MKKYTLFISTMLFLLIALVSCKKDFLDKKPATNINVPSTISDLQLLLDDTQDLYYSPGFGDLSSDDLTLGTDEWTNLGDPVAINTYVWAKDIFAGQGGVPDWNKPYTEVLTANVALTQLNTIERNSSNSADYDNLKGMALFMRAYMFFDLAQIFALPYDASTAGTDLGIPLRLTPDINAKTTRASLQATYNQVLSDAKQAKTLLKVKYVDNYFNRPTKASAYGFLSRVYLTMRDYKNAGTYADSALMLHNTLIDYNQVDSTVRYPFSFINDEVLYQNNLVNSVAMFYLYRSEGYSIDTLLYRSYDKNDLRKLIYFKQNGNSINLKAGYSENRNTANSIATDELYLTRAECNARTGNNQKAMDDLNTLLIKRWVAGTYAPLTNLSGTALLKIILTERRKELVMRGLRWNDIRRLNKEGYNITLTRNLNGTIYTLPPNDPRFALPIPPDVMSLTGIQQNNR